MTFLKRHTISKVITVALFFFFVFANVYTIRRLSRYAVEFYFYDKLFVAFQIGGNNGLNKELENILSQDKLPRELILAKAFKKDLNKIQAPDKFLKNILEEKRRDINLFRHLRNIAFGCIAVLILLRIWLNYRIKFGK